MITWYDKYKNLPYKHLGEDIKIGIDCLNLVKLIYLNELGIKLPYSTKDFCNDTDDEWYNRTENTKYTNPFDQFRNPKWGWEEVKILKEFDVITLSVGSTNTANHCAIYLGDNKILNIMIGKPSWVAPYGRWYKQYTNGIYRWSTLDN